MYDIFPDHVWVLSMIFFFLFFFPRFRKKKCMTKIRIETLDCLYSFLSLPGPKHTPMQETRRHEPRSVDSRKPDASQRKINDSLSSLDVKLHLMSSLLRQYLHLNRQTAITTTSKPRAWGIANLLHTAFHWKTVRFL